VFYLTFVLRENFTREGSLHCIVLFLESTFCSSAYLSFFVVSIISLKFMNIACSVNYNQLPGSLRLQTDLLPICHVWDIKLFQLATIWYFLVLVNAAAASHILWN